MSAKKTGCLRKIWAVVFATIVAPVLANLATQEVKDWQLALEGVLAGKPAASADWNRPIVEGPARPSHDAPPSAGRTMAATARPAPSPVQTPSRRKFVEWHWAAASWGQ